jgi:hypothetical protein
MPRDPNKKSKPLVYARRRCPIQNLAIRKNCLIRLKTEKWSQSDKSQWEKEEMENDGEVDQLLLFA